MLVAAIAFYAGGFEDFAPFTPVIYDTLPIESRL
jgi:hypothetical protein